MTKIQLRRDTASNWTTNNPTPASGEPCYETDTRKFKIGDGVTKYTNLPYQGGGGGSTTDSYTKSETDALLSKKNNNIFDISKFKVAGNPTITDDGVVSGFSSTSFIESKDTYRITTSDKVIITESFITGKTKADGYSILSGIGSRNNGIILYTTPITSANFLALHAFGTDIVGIRFDEVEFIPYQKYYYMIEKNLNSITLSLKKEGDTSYFKRTGTFQGDDPTSVVDQHLICGRESALTYSIDLKYASLEINGKEVFNGLMESTKPIYDAIKANNSELSEFKTESSTNFSAVNSALNEKANLTDLALKQNLLVSGTNIKTINGETLLGKGDITVGGSAPTNMVTMDTDQTITGKKVFLQPNSSNKGLNVALGSDATNPDVSVHIGKGSNSDFTGGMIRFDSTAPKIVGLQQSNSSGTMKIASSGDLINYASGTTEIRNGATWNTSKSGIRIPANSKSNPQVEIVGGSKTAGSSSGVDAKISIGFEGTGAWASRKGVFIETSATTNAADSGAKLWLGQANYRSAIYPVSDAALGRILNIETYVGDSGNAKLSIQKSDVVYTDSDGVAHSLIAGSGANTDLSNLSDIGKNNLVDNNCYDFDNPTNITVGATGASYTMPATGLLYIQGHVTSSTGFIGYKLPDGNFNNTRTPLSSGETLAVTLRVKKGQEIIIQYEEANNMKALVYPCFPSSGGVATT